MQIGSQDSRLTQDLGNALLGPDQELTAQRQSLVQPTENRLAYPLPVLGGEVG